MVAYPVPLHYILLVPVIMRLRHAQSEVLLKRTNWMSVASIIGSCWKKSLLTFSHSQM